MRAASTARESVTEQPASSPRIALSWRKKLAFTVLTLLLLAAPAWLILEGGYRLFFSIPFTAGVVGENDSDVPEYSMNPKFISRFKHSDNSILVYEPRPGANAGIYSINSDGLRDREFSRVKAPDVFRIVVLGDSIVWGHGLELQDTFARQLETMLNEDSDRTFEVINFGVSGYSTQQEVELYRVKARHYDPDLVIVGYCLNDFLEYSAEGKAFKRADYESQRVAMAARNKIESIYTKSYLYEHLRRYISGVSYNQLGYLASPPQAQFDLREQFRLLESYRDGRRSLIVIFPQLDNFQNYMFAVDHRRLQDAVADLNYETLDLLDVFRDVDADSLVQTRWDRTHPNAHGTQLAAIATLEVLAEKQLIPIAPEAVNR